MEFSDLWPYVSAILALLLIWQYHQNQILTGRIKAVDIFDGSGIRMYVYATPDDEGTCEACREVNGKAFLPSIVARKDFSPWHTACINTGRCTVVRVGLYGSWPEAARVVQRLRSAGKEGSCHLSFEELVGLIKGKSKATDSAPTDRFAVVMLAALGCEKVDAGSALTCYQQIIQQAQEVRDLPLVAPAYLRSVEILARQGQNEEALALVEQFEKRYREGKSGPNHPTRIQRGMISIEKTRLKTAVNRAKPKAEPQPQPDAAEVTAKTVV